MNCKQVQYQILEHGPGALGPEVRRHLETCNDCRIFLDVFQAVVTGRSQAEDSPPEAVDAAILRAAHAPARRRGRVTEFPKTAFSFPPWLRSAAAAAAVLLWGAFLWLGNHPENGRSPALQHPALGSATPDAVWKASKVDEDLTTLETRLASMNSAANNPGAAPAAAASAGDARNTPMDSEGNHSIDEALLKLDADLYFEKTELQNENAAVLATNGM